MPRWFSSSKPLKLSRTIFSSVGGPKDKGYLGRSAVAAPLKGVVGRAEGPDAQVKIVDVDLDVLQVSRWPPRPASWTWFCIA